jgi:threonine/homoserine/homoserine lactone efflux protein
MPAFVPDLPVLLAFALATVILAITPGPDMALQLAGRSIMGVPMGWPARPAP